MIKVKSENQFGYFIVNGPSTVGEAICHFCKLHEGDELLVNFLLDLYNLKDQVSISFYNNKLLEFPRELKKKNRTNIIFDCLNDALYYSNGKENTICQFNCLEEDV